MKSASKERDEWRFPKGLVEDGELLHEAAQRDLLAECGPNMNTWVVGRRPIGLLEQELENQESSETLAEKMFFFKAHIFAGQATPNESSVSDFAWLTKEEIQSRVADAYWLGTRDMLSDF